MSRTFYSARGHAGSIIVGQAFGATFVTVERTTRDEHGDVTDYQAIVLTYDELVDIAAAANQRRNEQAEAARAAQPHDDAEPRKRRPRRRPVADEDLD